MGFQEREAAMKAARTAEAAGEAGAGEGEAGEGEAPPGTEAGGDGAQAGRDGAGGVEGEGGHAEGEEASEGREKGGLQERIEGLVTKQRTAERQRDYYRKLANGEQPTAAEFAAVGEAYRVLRPGEGARPAAKREPEPPAAEVYDGTDGKDPMPTRAQFTGDDGVLDDDGYLDARSAWNARKIVRQQQHDAQQAEAQQSRQAVEERGQQLYEEMVEAGRAAYPDFDELMGSNELKITPQMAVAAIESGMGHHVLHFLDQHRDEADRIAGLSVNAQMVEIGALTAQFREDKALKAGAAGDDAEPGAAQNGAAGAAGATAKTAPARRTTGAPAAPSASPSGGGPAVTRAPKAGTNAAVMAHRTHLRETGKL